MAAAEDVTMEDVARIMREEDAQLLESMRFEQSCSTGETPVLTSMDGNLNHVEDMSLLDETTAHDDDNDDNNNNGEHGLHQYCPKTCIRKKKSSGGEAHMMPHRSCIRRVLSNESAKSADHDTHTHTASATTATVSKSMTAPRTISASSSPAMARQRRRHSEHDTLENNDDEEEVIYRQCLSGEIKSFRASSNHSPMKTKRHLSLQTPPAAISQLKVEEKEDQRADGEEEDDDYEETEEKEGGATPEGEETTASSTCCSHDGATVPSVDVGSAATGEGRSLSTGNTSSNITDHSQTEHYHEEKRRRDSSQTDRRIKEAVQFAQAVGEMPPIDSNTELCIIDEYDDDDTDDDDNGEDGNGTVIRLDELESQIGSIHDHGSLGGTITNDMDRFAITGADEKPISELHLHLNSLPNQQQQSQSQLQSQYPSSTTSVNSDIPREIIKRKSRPHWPIQCQLPGWTFSHLDTSTHASRETTVQDYVYKGIRSNPPEIVSRGISRGNHVQLHRKAWLEVSDKYHRYGKNLRLYYRHWESLGYPTNMFFDWLDSKGEAAGQPLPNLEECPRSKLDSDTVLYIANPKVTEGYSLKIVTTEEGQAKFLDVDGETVRTGPDGWIFVLRDGVIYGAEKVTSINGQSKQRFHHSSFFGGKAVAAAGIFLTDDEGILTRLYPHSGHYRPREAHMQRLLYFLYHEGVDLRTFEMDVQQIMHVNRDTDDKKDKKEKEAATESKEKPGEPGDHETKKEGERKKKIDSLQLWPAVTVACYVAHKAHFIGDGIFAQIHQIRNANVTTVSEALEYVNAKKCSCTALTGSKVANADYVA